MSSLAVENPIRKRKGAASGGESGGEETRKRTRSLLSNGMVHLPASSDVSLLREQRKNLEQGNLPTVQQPENRARVARQYSSASSQSAAGSRLLCATLFTEPTNANSNEIMDFEALPNHKQQLQLPPMQNQSRRPPSVVRQVSFEPTLFEKIPTTTEDQLSQITPTLFSFDAPLALDAGSLDGGFAPFVQSTRSGLASNQSEISATLSGVKHDHHSLLAAAINPEATRADTNNNIDSTDPTKLLLANSNSTSMDQPSMDGLSNLDALGSYGAGQQLDDELLMGSLPPQIPNATVATAAGWPVQESPAIDSKSCLPFGYYYESPDDNLPVNVSDNSGSSLMSVKSEPSDPLSLDDEWILDDKMFLTGNANDLSFENGQCWNMNASNYLSNCQDADIKPIKKDTGPTLAELNLSDDMWDSLDIDELLASSQSLHKPSNMNRPRLPFYRNQPEKENIRISQPQSVSSVHVVPSTVSQTDDSKAQEGDFLSHLFGQNSRNSPPGGGTPPKQAKLTSCPLPPSQSQSSLAFAAPHLNISLLPGTGSPVKMELPNGQQLSATVLPASTLLVQSAQLPQPVLTNNTTVLSALLNSQNTKVAGPSSGPLKPAISNGASMSTSKSSTVTFPELLEAKPETKPRIRNTSMSTEASFSSHDGGYASQPEDGDSDDGDDGGDIDDSDDESFYGDYDAKDLLGATTSDDANNKWALNMGRARKGGQQRYFWQYNVQSKGPKGTRAPQAADETAADPHVLAEASDPVFAADCRVEGVKHAGKARRGDGNDLTPNPRKLLMIGLELKKLSKVINDLTPVAEVPVNARNKTRKEKNKLASRACRLKKKAQHEANKIKLFGLQQEHRKMMNILAEIKRQVKKQIEIKAHGGNSQSPLTAIFNQVLTARGPVTSVAGKTTDFVNGVLDNVAEGQATGGLDRV